jgi:mono/diheme cytochrome c family protein
VPERIGDKIVRSNGICAPQIPPPTPGMSTTQAIAATAFRTLGVLAVSALMPLGAATLPPKVENLIEDRCADCHDSDEKKGGLDLNSLSFDPTDGKNFAIWVKVFDRVSANEMPPKKKPRLKSQELADFTGELGAALTEAEIRRTATEGRSTLRRLNRYEYENTVRDLLGAPWLQLKDGLPEDGEAYRYNKIGESLDMSHVQLARYLGTADRALRQVLAAQPDHAATKVTRYYSREQASFTDKMKFDEFNTAPERATFAVLGVEAQPDVRSGKDPMSVGDTYPEERDREGVGVVASNYEPVEVYFENFVAPVSGHYRLRFKAYPVWVGPGEGSKWFIPDLDHVSTGHRPEPITVYSETPPHQLRTIGKFDVTPEAPVRELDTWLLAGEIIRPDAARFFRSRPGASRWHNPLAEKDGQPGVVFSWMDVEGPIFDQWPTPGYELLFGGIPLGKPEHPGWPAEVVSRDPEKDARRLLSTFARRAYRRPVTDAEALRFLPIVENALKAGSSFSDAMIAGYSAVLCSPDFLYLEESPGALDEFALASRLSYFLWNSAPDGELLELAGKGMLHQTSILRAQTERMLDDPKSAGFVEAFLAYWLQLRKMSVNSPDPDMYPDYYLDDLLTESALEETHAFFTELVRGDLPARNVVDSDFAFVNERLASLYGIPGVEGVALRKVTLPPGSVRGGLMTQASVLKVTANGTTTSPVLRGVWIMERILGRPPPPPPPNVPALEPDTRGAATIRELLEKHRSQPSCAACHAKIDPAGFALENFDVMGGWRDRYRALGGSETQEGLGHNGQKFAFHPALLVDSSSQLPDGRSFTDIRSFKKLLLGDERQIARNLARQLLIYATGAPVRFGDRAEVERMLQDAASRQYGVRTLIHEVVESSLFLHK